MWTSEKTASQSQETAFSLAPPAVVHPAAHSAHCTECLLLLYAMLGLRMYEGTQQGGPGENSPISTFPSAAPLHQSSGFNMMTWGVILGVGNKRSERQVFRPFMGTSITTGIQSLGLCGKVHLMKGFTIKKV